MTAEFIPTPEQRRTARAMAAYGIPQIEIAAVIGISDRTLRKAFREELDRAATEANAKVAEVCFRMATSGKVPAATFFWLKTRAGWREVNRFEHTGGQGGPIQVAALEDSRKPIAEFMAEFLEERSDEQGRLLPSINNAPDPEED
ncbi:MAG: hypothetical protein JSS43_13575 [Proteobacteria bacterium]|nr:hypothetical protein [Pseudomonadota bacterium]